MKSSIHVKLSLFIGLLNFGLLQCGEVIKCLKEQKERIRISCPRGHVIYDPVIVGGAGTEGTCEQMASHCTGEIHNLKRQTDRCFWKKRCIVKLRKSDRILSCSNNSTSSNLTYVIIKQAFCVPKESVVDICKTSSKQDNWSPGILRSYRSYPKVKPVRLNCNLTIPLDSKNTLYLETVSSRRHFPRGLRILSETKSRSMHEINSTGLVILHGNETSSVRIMVNYKKKRNLREGFVILFAAYRTKSVNEILQWPKKSRPVMTELGFLHDVRPVIEQCAASSQGHMTLTCDEDEVIYSPAVSLAAFSYLYPKCSFRRQFKCGGFTADLLVQRNVCYWRQKCDITWRQTDRIILSKEPKCLGYYASTIGLAGHRCVQKSNIFDVCTEDTSRVNVSWGVFRSHESYPWYFNAKECKRIIIIGRRRAGMLIVQDMNIDPDGRDKFTVEHVTKGHRRKIMDNKSSKEGTQTIVRGGKLVIHFKPFKATKSGRGFILIFRRFRISKTEFDNPKLGHSLTTTTSILSDAAHGMKHRFSNRRLCSMRGKRRKQGKSCHSRVWTDYFIRLE